MTGSIFVGRERHMAAVHASVAEALGGRGQLLLLVGEPGIGKTRLAEESATHARQQGAQVCWGRCWEGESAPAFWPWVQIVRSYARERDTATLIAEMGPGAADIVQVVPELHERLPDVPAGFASAESEQARFRLLDSLTTFLRNAAGAQPLVLVLDDLHWADKASLLVLEFLAGEMREARIVVVGTYRDVDLRRQHPLKQTLADLARYPFSQHLSLHGLTEADVARFIEQAAGVSPPDSLVRAVHKESEGNPFFVSEIVRLLAAEGRLDQSVSGSLSLTIPQTIREVVGRRLSRLSEGCNRMLTVASVIGREFDLIVLERASDLSSDRLLEALDEAIVARIVGEEPQGVGRYRFVHTLIRDTLYEEIPVGRRVRLHRRIGETLEDVYAANPDRHLASFAHHFLKAAPGGDLARVVEYAFRAGSRASQLLAYEEAAAHYKVALEAHDLIGPDEARRCETMLCLGEAQRKGGQMAEARQTFLRAAEIARSTGVPELLARAALGLGEPWGELGYVDTTLVGLLEEADRALGPQESGLRARVLARLAIALYFSPSEERRIRLSDEAVEMARHLGEEETAVFALGAKHVVLWQPRNAEDRLAIATEIVRVAEKLGDKEIAVRWHHWRCVALLELGDVSAADQALEACARLAEEVRQPRYRWFTTLTRATRALMSGRFEDAERLAYEAYSIGQRVHDPIADQYLCVQLLALRRGQGRLAELATAVKNFVDRYPAIPAWRAVLARIQCEFGSEAEARNALEILTANAFADVPEDGLRLISLGLLAEVCAFLGDVRSAGILYELLLPYAGRNIVVGVAGACDGSVSRHLGVLATTMQRWEEAARHFENAVEMNAKMGAKPHVALSQHDHANMLALRGGSGGREKAAELLALATATYRELGMDGCVQRALAMFERLEASGQVRPRAGDPPLVAGPGAREAFPNDAQRPAHSRSGSTPTPVAERPAGSPGGANIFRREGQYWTIVYGGTDVRLRDTKGLQYIAQLLRHPGRQVHAVDLMVTTAQPSPKVGSRAFSQQQVAENRLRVARLGYGELVLDRQARDQYANRLRELSGELDEARSFNDWGRAAKLQRELDMITEQLAAASRRGRSRPRTSPAERARINVRNGIKTAMETISQHNEPLWRHLFNGINTGTFCSYTPEQPVSWTL